MESREEVSYESHSLVLIVLTGETSRLACY
jgi:hypothetical protein